MPARDTPLTDFPEREGYFNIALWRGDQWVITEFRQYVPGDDLFRARCYLITSFMGTYMLWGMTPGTLYFVAKPAPIPKGY